MRLYTFTVTGTTCINCTRSITAELTKHKSSTNESFFRSVEVKLTTDDQSEIKVRSIHPEAEVNQAVATCINRLGEFALVNRDEDENERSSCRIM